MLNMEKKTTIIASVVVCLIGPALLVFYILWISYLERNYLSYSNHGSLHEDLGNIDYDAPYEDTDPSLVWMMRSREYVEATKEAKVNMRRTWAKDYTDRHIGRFVRLMTFLPFMVFPVLSLFMLLFSLAGCD